MSDFFTLNPYTGETLRPHSYMGQDQVLDLVSKAHQSFKKWSEISLESRAEFLFQLAKGLRSNSKKIAEMMTAEMGKPIKHSYSEIEKCAVTCEFFAKNGVNFLSPEAHGGYYRENEIQFAPLGVILAIMPWNFPLWQVIRFAAPAIMAGNVVILKHSDLVAGTAEILSDLFKSLSEPTLLFNAPMTHETCAQVIAHPLIQGVTFTGSTRGGKQIASLAGQSVKKIVLELGGSDAYLILKDADITKAAAICAQARLNNGGQSCVAAKRFIVEQEIFEEFTRHLVNEMKTFKMGNPTDESVQLGPLASKKFQKNIITQVEKLKLLGGKIVLGGTAPEGPAAFYPPTVVVFEKNHPELGLEEVFGPVAIVIKAKNTDEALDVANSSIYGLGGAIFSKNISLARALAAKLQCGFVAINSNVVSDARMPFGGVKESGYGRELSRYGLLEFCNIKTVGINL